jgi:dihydroorotase-like cyclic amidohydrolase
VPDFLIRSAHVGNLVDGVGPTADVAIEDGKIAAIAADLPERGVRRVVEAGGRTVLPGLVDTHVHVSGEFGHRLGFGMMLKAGVTSALDMAGDPLEIRATANQGRGMTIGVLFPVIPGKTVADRDPSAAELRQLLEQQLERGALGLKVLGGHYPLTPEATARVFEACADARAYAAIHVGSTETGSDVDGLAEAVTLAAGRRVHLAHINSYCRGQISDPVAEAAQAIGILENAANAVSESYLSRINAADATCEDGVPVSRVVVTCLRLGGYGSTEAELRRAIEDGWAAVHGEMEGEIRLLDADRGLDLYQARGSAVAVSFAVNPASASLAIALARRQRSPDFVVDAFSTDGGSLPRNTTLVQGMALVAAHALTLREFSWKASGAPARMLGLDRKGRLEVGCDADLIVVGSGGQCDLTMIGGKIAWGDDAAEDPAKPAMLCHPAGVQAVAGSTMAIGREFGG